MILCAQSRAERFEIRLVASGVLRINCGQVRGHLSGDHHRVARAKPKVGVYRAGAVLIVMIVARRDLIQYFVVTMFSVLMLLAEVA
ncbi:hypothetical protein D3C76_1714210 [compost metagenome]